MFENSFAYPKASLEGIERKKEAILESLSRKNLECEEKIEKEGFSKKYLAKFASVLLAGSLVMGAIAKEQDIKKSLEHFITPTEVVYYTGNSDLITVDKVINLEVDKPVRINEKVSNETREHWKMEYMGNSKLSDSLVRAYHEMKENWEPKLKEIFQSEGVPEKFMYLAIPESHWKLDAVSPAEAVGPYQFTKDTGVRYGLVKLDKKGNIVEDKRKDPIESARACARLLKDLHEKTGDWNLALAGYNGGFIWEYLDDCRDDDRKADYNDFLSYIEKKANQFKKEYHTGNMAYKVRKGDTLEEISAKFKISKWKLKKDNNLKTGKLEKGQILRMVVADKKVRENIFQKRRNGLAENLNYPPKFNAVIEIIEGGIS